MQCGTSGWKKKRGLFEVRDPFFATRTLVVDHIPADMPPCEIFRMFYKKFGCKRVEQIITVPAEKKFSMEEGQKRTHCYVRFAKTEWAELSCRRDDKVIPTTRVFSGRSAF